MNTWHTECTYHQYADDKQEHGHEHLGTFLYTITHPTYDNQVSQKHKYDGRQKTEPRIGHVIVEKGLVVTRRVRQCSSQTAIGIIKRPATDHDIVAQYQECHTYAHKAYDTPPLAWSQLAKCIYHIALRVAANNELAHHDRYADEQYRQNIYKDECRTAIVANQHRETPYITQSHGTACRSKDGSHTGTEVYMLFHYPLIKP